MTKALKSYMAEHFGLDKDASDEDAKALVSAKLDAKQLSTDKYMELLEMKDTKTASPADKLAELLDANSTKTAKAVADALTPALTQIAAALSGKAQTESKEAADAKSATDTKSAETAETPDYAKQLAEMESRLEKKLRAQGVIGGDGAALQAMFADTAEDHDDTVRVKRVVDQYSHTPTALTYKKIQSKHLGLLGMPMMFNEQEVNAPTERSKALAAAWLKLQLFPESMNERETSLVKWQLHNSRFNIPNRDNNIESRHLTEHERQQVWEFNKNFYAHGYKTLLDDSTSGGEHATPETYDMDMIIAPTLASENIPSYCNVVPWAKGSAAENFILGRPTVAAHTEGTGVTVFTTTGLIADHTTQFFRAMGALHIGKDFLADAHPRIMMELQNQYRASTALWFNEQIMAGDGTTEPTGILNSSGTYDVTPTNPTTGDIVANDLLNLLFGVDKAHRYDGGRENLIYVMTDTTYKRIRQIATGITGDTRWIFGEDVEGYKLFGHPVLIEQAGLGNNHAVFMQAKGYRLYIRQAVRFFREDRGDTLVRANTVLVGCDLRAGGKLDLGAYAAVVDGFPA